jgi:hypothetical protein
MFRLDARKESPGTGNAAASLPAVACPLLRPFLRRVEKLQTPPRVILLGEMCGSNVSYLGERGYQVAVEGSPAQPPRYQEVHAGALLWDHLSLVNPAVAAQWILRVAEGLIPGGAVLALFPPAKEGSPCPRTRFRIISDELISREILQQRTDKPQVYQNRDIIRLFAGFNLDLLHTHRSGHREVLFFKGKSAGADPTTISPPG